MWWIAVPLLIGLVARLPVHADENASLVVRAGEPQLYAYRNAFGETEHYLVVRYEVQNRSSQPRVNAARTTMLSGEGSSLNDGYRPLVLSAFCREIDCGTPPVSSTAEVHGARLAPGGSLAAVALFRVPGALPERETILAGEAPGVDYDRSTPSGYSRAEAIAANAKPPGKVREEAPGALAGVTAADPEPAASPRHLAARSPIQLAP